MFRIRTFLAWYPTTAWEPTSANLRFATWRHSCWSGRSQAELGSEVTCRSLSGYTLAELLIVMTIMLMLMAITLPTVRRVMEDGKVREASRQLNAYFAMAKSRALLTGRPCGV